jgi:1-acyl-sn-glycerol-3-phosphate acyltransferase
MVRWIARIVLAVFFNTIAVVDVTGMENIPAQGSYVAVSNHLGRLDPALVYYILPRKDVYLMVAEKYQKYAFVRWLVKHLNGMFIDRYNADFRALRLMLERLQAGGVVALAPEGTRSRSVALIQAWPGASYLAAKAGVPVLPVAVTGTEDVVVKDRLRHFRRIQIHLRIGKPFMLPALTRQERDKILQQSTDEMMCQIAALLPPPYRGVYADHPRLAELIQSALSQV